MAHGGAPVEQVDAAQRVSLRATGALQRKAAPQVRKACRLGVLLCLCRRDMARPDVDVCAVTGDFGALQQVHIKAGAKDNGIEMLHPFAGVHLNVFSAGPHVAPLASQAQREAGMRVAAAHGFPGRGHLLVKDVGVEAPFARIVQRLEAAQKTLERRGLAFVDLRQHSAAGKLGHTRTGLQRAGCVVKGRGACTQHGHVFACQCGEVDGVGGVEHPARRQWIGARERGVVRPARRAAAVASQGQNQLACAHGLFAVRALQPGAHQPVRIAHAQQAHAVVHRQADGVAHPQQIVTPVDAADLVQRGPAGRAVLRLVPGAEGEGGHAQVGAGELLGAAQCEHARIGAPGTFVAARVGVDDADIAHALAQQRVAGGLAAHAGPHHQHVQHLLAVRPRCGQHPIRRRVVEARQTSTRLQCQRLQGRAVPRAGQGLRRHGRQVGGRRRRQRGVRVHRH